MCPVDSVIPEAVPVSVTTGQVAGLRACGEPHAEMGNAHILALRTGDPDQHWFSARPAWGATVNPACEVVPLR
jgi:hypothetical protein